MDMDSKQILPKAVYQGVLPIGNVDISCAVLDNGIRVITQTSVFQAFDRPRKGQNDRAEIDGTKLPPFLASKSLLPFISPNVLKWTKQIEYLDGTVRKAGYAAALLPEMCEVYLNADMEGVLKGSQQKMVVQAKLLLIAFAKVGIDALIDEATGYQKVRNNDALRLLLSRYIAEGLQKWMKTFPDDFFAQLDRLYKNEPTTSRNRPIYYAKFINSYIYDPLENGYVKQELNKLNIRKDGSRKARFHQWLSNSGHNILLRKIYKVLAVMELASNICTFKQMIRKQKEISIAPFLFDHMNRIIEE